MTQLIDTLRVGSNQYRFDVGGNVAAKLIAKVKHSGSFGYTALLPESAAAQNPTVKITRARARAA
jgi:hypothetical protein